jgi:hypothetical protein
LVADTPAEWLPILAKRLDDRLPQVRLLQRYIDGDAPLPEMGANVRASWQKFQREARTNWGLLVQEAVADRIVPNGITVAGSTDSDVAKQAQRIWRDNRMDSVLKDWVRYGLTYAQSFLTCWVDDDGEAVITADSPETMCVSADPLQPWRVRAALRVWRDLDAEKDYCIVWCDGTRQKFSRHCYTGNVAKRRLVRLISGDWDAEGEPIDTGTDPPVVVYNNPGGYGEFEPHLDVINRINRGVLQRLVITAMQAFKQRALKTAEGTGGLPRKDPEGNDIDWAKVFEPAPGALWELPPGIEVWEAQATDIRPLLDGSKDDIRQLSSSTRTPLPMLMPDNANQSAQGAASADSGHLAKCADRCTEAKVGAAAILVKALQVEGTDLGDDDTVEVTFEPVAIVSLAEKFAAAAQAKAAGLPVKAILTHVLGWSPQQVTQAEADLADETPDPPPVMPAAPEMPGSQLTLQADVGPQTPPTP